MLGGEDTGWLSITYANGYAAQGSLPAVRRINGLVYTRGLVRPNPAGAFPASPVTIGSVPASCRPLANAWTYQRIDTASLTTSARLVVKDTGDLEVECSNTASGWVSIVVPPWRAA